MVMPLVMAGIVCIIYTGFYLYDVCVIRQASYGAAVRAARQSGLTADGMKRYAQKQLEDLLEKRLLMTEEKTTEIKISSRKVRILVTASVKLPVSGFLSEKLNLWKIRSEAEAVRADPVKLLRHMGGGNES